MGNCCEATATPAVMIDTQPGAPTVPKRNTLLSPATDPDKINYKFTFDSDDESSDTETTTAVESVKYCMINCL